MKSKVMPASEAGVSIKKKEPRSRRGSQHKEFINSTEYKLDGQQLNNIEDNQADELAKQFALMLNESDSDDSDDGRDTERQTMPEDKKTLEEDSKDWEVKSIGSSNSEPVSDHSFQSSHSKSSVGSGVTTTSTFSSIVKGETAQDIKQAKGGTDEELGAYQYDHVTQNKIRDCHKSYWHKPLQRVDKMLFSTDCSETPMIINTILFMENKINITQVRLLRGRVWLV